MYQNLYVYTNEKSVRHIIVKIRLQMCLTYLQNMKVCSAAKVYLHAFVQLQHWVVRFGRFIPGCFNAYDRQWKVSE